VTQDGIWHMTKENRLTDKILTHFWMQPPFIPQDSSPRKDSILRWPKSCYSSKHNQIQSHFFHEGNGMWSQHKDPALTVLPNRGNTKIITRLDAHLKNRAISDPIWGWRSRMAVNRWAGRAAEGVALVWRSPPLGRHSHAALAWRAQSRTTA
jgi:hypothetical protein